MEKRAPKHQAFDPSSLPVPDRSDQVPQRVKADPDDQIDLFAQLGTEGDRFKDGRPYCGP